jgi:2-methylcitrate dehydratase PrpD
MMLDIISENDISDHDIESINIHVGPVDYTCNRPKPTDTEDARFSFQHIMAALMLEGEVDSRHFTEGTLRERRFRDVWKKTSVTNHPEWPTEFMSGVARIEIILTNGEKVTKEKIQARGGPDAPLSEDEFHSLFEKYTRDVLSKEATDKTWRLLSQLEQLDRLNELLESLSKKGPMGG